MSSVAIRKLTGAICSLLFALALTLVTTYAFAGSGTVTVSGTQWGITSQYLGANEGSSQFNINNLVDLGINSDYSWSASTGIPPVNAATIISDLNAHNITPIIVLRNRDNNGNPSWSPNPPTTAADWNVWFEHVFATVYWFNVRNSYKVDNWEVHNEPNNSGQGWGGTESQYMDFINYTAQAIHWVYSHYLPGRTPHIYAPVTSNCCSWALSAMQTEGPSVFDSLDFHDYQSNPSEIATLRADMNANGFSGATWSTEMGSYHQNSYDTASSANNKIISWWVQASRPGNNYVTGAQIFSLYDWGSGYTSGIVHGSYPAAEAYQSGYYAMRLASRALCCGRATYQTTSTISNLVSVVTKDSAGHYYLVACNSGSPAATVTANLSALIMSGTGTQWEFSAAKNDVIVGTPSLTNGQVTFTVPANSTELLKF
jgi:hypothetical protein